MGWTDDELEQLKAMWAEGLTASTIGRAIGKTRNAVLGKSHRIGLPGRAHTPAIRQPRVYVPKAKSLPVQVVLFPALVLENGLHATTETVDDTMCRWPIGDPVAEEFHFCGNVPHEGHVYCAAHVKDAYQPKKDYVRPHRAKLR